MTNTQQHKRVFSGVQPTGDVHIGNYLGAMKQFVDLQHQADCFFCVVDLHALTLPQEPEQLRQKTLEVAALYLAIGLDPKQATIFVQSHVPGHAELGWLLQCVARMGEMSRMTQFKEKGEGRDTVSVGLFTYPALMAADILLYQTDVVPVGEDQKQHLELTRDLAERFNTRFGETFRIPEPFIGKVGARIMSLDEPTKKMSKSSPSPASRITLLEEPDSIRKKLMRAVTDADNEIRFDEDQKPGVSNLLSIYSLFSGESIDQIAGRFTGQGYGTLKKELVEVVIDKLTPVQQTFHRLMNDRSEIEQILRMGANKAEQVALVTLTQVKEKMGLVRR
ncbi:MAG: tryptophanyl-tRNA synthetase [Bacilli bacterium]|nr:tryptophanyl-tRNA synthetase [Bacilli bacterium]